tara:strand:+ start:179 stop:361 length:183 start_codon:yes stop_codon:yes gene_type:complete
MALKFSFGIIFSIFLFGAGKLILEINIITKNRRINTKKTFIRNLLIVVNFPELVFFVNCI